PFAGPSSDNGPKAALSQRSRPTAASEKPPLSFAQQRLWFLDRLEPGSSLYNIPTLFHLTGRLDRGALTRALGEIVRRHEVLRTRFEAVAGMPDSDPIQVIEPLPELPFPLVDLAGLEEPARRAAAVELARREARRPFDLTRAPLLRVVLLRRDAGTHLLLLTVHHIAFDGWSIDVALRELAALYQAFANGDPSPLPELDVQYADFAVWQRRWLAGEALESQLAYWRQQLAGLPVRELPCDRPRPAIQRFRGAVESFQLPAALHSASKSSAESAERRFS
ncbi:MAG: hypothetical protein GY856_12380, partial [bacterium]|nr:hypothetical protein [bacterium]